MLPSQRCPIAVVRIVLAAAAVSAAVYASEALAHQGAKKSDSVVKATASAAKPDASGRQTITVTLTIDKSWHTYANKLPEEFPGLPTAVTVEGKMKPEDVKVEYPTGKVVKDKMLGDYHVYEGTQKITVLVRRAKGDTGRLLVDVKVQACSDKQCLLPSVIKLTVD
jgi:DsbC/DsbD-like thiol-disulfide interchange protein